MTTAFSLTRRILPLLAGFAVACSGPVKSGQPEPAPPSADPALWAVADEDTTIYLFGTVHMLKPDVVWFDDEVKAAFDRSDELVLEVTKSEPSEMAVAVAMMGLNEEQPTREMLPEKLRPAYLAALDRYKLPAGAMDRIDPWLVAINLSVAPLVQLGYRQDLGAEYILEQTAEKAGKTVEGLETTEEQLGYFDGLPREVQIAYLRATVEELPKVESEFAQLMETWKTGKPDALAAKMNESLKETPEMAQVLLYDRNARWAEWIDERLDRPGVVFVAVGAGHLAGEKSVIDMLEAEKLQVRRLSKKDFGLE